MIPTGKTRRITGGQNGNGSGQKSTRRNYEKKRTGDESDTILKKKKKKSHVEETQNTCFRGNDHANGKTKAVTLPPLLFYEV